MEVGKMGGFSVAIQNLYEYFEIFEHWDMILLQGFVCF